MPDLFNTPTVRKTILEKVKSLYEAVTVSTYGVDFPRVKHGPLGTPDSTKRIMIGVVSGEERKSDLYPLKTSLWDINIEFSVTAQTGEVPSLLYEQVLGVVQQVIYDHQDLDGLVIDMTERRSQMDQFTYADKTIMGVVTFECHYRHNTQTVYSPDPSV